MGKCSTALQSVKSSPQTAEQARSRYKTLYDNMSEAEVAINQLGLPADELERTAWSTRPPVSQLEEKFMKHFNSMSKTAAGHSSKSDQPSALIGEGGKAK
ncbi:hypothetical protein I317_02187 [Kwoniella heveanensis CBS 569]|nr:hypothetical protein I317_02187 [Kwoniella heveanensis CBS 569]